MRIGILGSGDVAKALAGGFIGHGHEPMLGTKDPRQTEEAISRGSRLNAIS